MTTSARAAVLAIFCSTVGSVPGRGDEPAKDKPGNVTATATVQVLVKPDGGKAEDDDLNRMRFPGRIPGGEPEAMPGATVEWLASDTRAVRREAIRRAVSNAKENARAATDNATLHVIEILVLPADRYPPVRVPVRAGTAGLEAGLVPVRVDVRVVCSY